MDLRKGTQTATEVLKSTLNPKDKLNILPELNQGAISNHNETKHTHTPWLGLEIATAQQNLKRKLLLAKFWYSYCQNSPKQLLDQTVKDVGLHTFTYLNVYHPSMTKAQNFLFSSIQEHEAFCTVTHDLLLSYRKQ